MNAVSKILVPVDFSDYTPQVVAFAADLSRRYEASLEFFYAWEPVAYARPEGYILLSDEDIARVTKRFQDDLTKLALSAKAAGALVAETRLVQGYPATAIVSHAKHEKFDLIVMGTHGRSGLKHLLIGSVAENVVRTAPCPVLTVRAVERAAHSEQK